MYELHQRYIRLHSKIVPLNNQMKKELTIPELIKWIDHRIKALEDKKELPNDLSDFIQLGGKISAFKEIRHLLQEKWVEV